MTVTTRLICVDGGSNKFWEGRVDGTTLHLRWGKIGATGQSKEKQFPDAPAAERELEKVVAEKLAGGYQRDDGSGPPASTTPPVAVASSAPASAAGAPPAKKPARSKKSALSKKAANALMESGDTAGIVAAVEKSSGAAQSFAPGLKKLFMLPEAGRTPEAAAGRRDALNALLGAGLSPSPAAYLIVATTWILSPSEKRELLAEYWDQFDASAKREVFAHVLMAADTELVDFVIARAEVEPVIGLLNSFSTLEGLALPKGAATLTRLQAVLAKLSPAELDRTSGHQVFEEWLYDSRERVFNRAYGCGLVHLAAGGAVPGLLRTLLDRGASPTLRTTQPSQWTLPESTNPVKSSDYAIVELPAGATALDLATQCHQQMSTLVSKFARLGDSLTSVLDKQRYERNQAPKAAVVERYREVVQLLESRGVTANPTALQPERRTWDTGRALEQYLSLCEAMGQDLAATRAAAERIEAPSSIVAYWRELAEKNQALSKRLEDEGLRGLLFDDKSFYDDSYLSGEAEEIAANGELLCALDADAWYDVEGVIWQVHPEGAAKIGSYDVCMRQLREAILESAG